jgi:hypothetical protein
LSDKAAADGADPDLAMRSAQLADRSRQMLLTAHELCAREAEARAKIAPETPPWFVSDDDPGAAKDQT